MKSRNPILFLMIVVISVSVMIGCSTVKGAGDDLDTLGRGISDHHKIPSSIEQDSSKK